MVLAYPLLAGVVLALLLGGDVRRLVALRLRALPLFYLALALQLAAFPVRFVPWRTTDHVAVSLWLVSYGVLAVAALLNVRLPAMPLIVLGLCANLAAIVANGGHMPVLPAALHAAGYDYTVHFNSAAIAHPHLAALVDRFAAPQWIPRANVYSVGDVLLACGGILLPPAVSGALGSFRARVAVLGAPFRATR
ncbi:MAG TPA: DUF5317 family protein [Gaiellaceae bacterium]|nr:DUF5317 family protein [Gaiellaceae bacterium]